MSCTPKTSVIVYVNYTSITLQTKITKLKEKKIRDTKGTFHAKMGTIKDRTVKLPVENSNIHYTQELPNDLS